MAGSETVLSLSRSATASGRPNPADAELAATAVAMSKTDFTDVPPPVEQRCWSRCGSLRKTGLGNSSPLHRCTPEQLFARESGVASCVALDCRGLCDRVGWG